MISHGLNRVPYLQTSPSGCFSSLMIPEVKYSFYEEFQKVAQSHCMVGPILVANLSQVHAGKGTGVLPPPDKTWLLERNAFRPIVWLDSWPENHHVCHIFHIGKNMEKRWLGFRQRFDSSKPI